MNGINIDQIENTYPGLRAKLENCDILFIDDEPDNLLLGQQILLFFTSSVRTAENGHKALALVREKRPSVILSDLSMPEMSGWELKVQLDTDPDLRTIPFIAVTAHATTSDRERIEAAGFTYYITKPFSPITLLATLYGLDLTGATAKPESSVKQGTPIPSAPPTPTLEPEFAPTLTVAAPASAPTNEAVMPPTPNRGQLQRLLSLAFLKRRSPSHAQPQNSNGHHHAIIADNTHKE